MQYQLIQDTLTSIVNCVAISGVAIMSTSIVSKNWNQSQPQQSIQSNLPEAQQQPESFHDNTQSQHLNRKIIELQEATQDLQVIKQELEQSYQDKLQLQTCLEAVQLELQQAQQKELQNQSELCQLQQQLYHTEEQLQHTQQILENTQEGLQGFVNRLFYLDRNAKARISDLFSFKELIQVIQPASE